MATVKPPLEPSLSPVFLKPETHGALQADRALTLEWLLRAVETDGPVDVALIDELRASCAHKIATGLTAVEAVERVAPPI